MSEDSKTLSEQFKQQLILALEEQGITRVQLSIESGIPTTTLSRWVGYTNPMFGHSTLNLRRLVVWLEKTNSTPTTRTLKDYAKELLNASPVMFASVSQEIANVQNEINEILVQHKLALRKASEIVGLRPASFRAVLASRNAHLTVERIKAIKADLEAYVKSQEKVCVAAKEHTKPKEQYKSSSGEEFVPVKAAQGFHLNEDRLRGLFEEE